MTHDEASMGGVGSAAAHRAKSARILAVIDIGSNAVRLLMSELLPHGRERVIADDRVVTRLAEALPKGGKLSSRAMEASVDVIERYAALARQEAAAGGKQVEIVAVATSAVRDAKNRAAFIRLVERRAGVTVRVLSGLDEGRLAWASASAAFDLTHGLCVVADLGGGSLQLVAAMNGVVFDTVSLPLGAVRLTNQFGGAESASHEQYAAMRKHVGAVIRAAVKEWPKSLLPVTRLVCCGGAATAMWSMAVRTGAHDPGTIDSPAPIGVGAVSALLLKLRRMNGPKRAHVPGLSPDRVDIIVPGLCVLERVMECLGAQALSTHAGGIRDGFVQLVRQGHTIDGNPEELDPPLALREARDLAHRAMYPRAHSEQVAKLSVELWRGLGSAGLLPESTGSEETLLTAAGLLHDVGIAVEYRRHHRRSAGIVRNAFLDRWPDADREVLAQVCRYHRRSEPSMEHAEFAAIPLERRKLVRALAGVLRVADGTDRSHTQAVQGLRVSVISSGRERKRGKRVSAKRVEILLEGRAGGLAAAAKDGARKCGLLEDLLGMKIRLRIEKAPRKKSDLKKKRKGVGQKVGQSKQVTRKSGKSRA